MAMKDDSLIMEFKGFSTFEQGNIVYSQSFEVAGYEWKFELNPKKTGADFLRPCLKLKRGTSKRGLHVRVDFDMNVLDGIKPMYFEVNDVKFHEKKLKRKIFTLVCIDTLVECGFVADDTLRIELRNFRVSRTVHLESAIVQLSPELVEDGRRLDQLLEMSVESVHREDAWSEFERILKRIDARLTSPCKKTAIGDILSRVEKFKRLIPECLETINTSKESRTRKRRTTTDLVTEISCIRVKKAKLAKKLQELEFSNEKLANAGKLKAVDLSVLQEEVSKASDELKKLDEEYCEAVFAENGAQHRLHKSNIYWKCFQEVLDFVVCVRNRIILV
ncbi:hypothetical protein LINPERHAP1_LOCUS12309 [Linum perenne]